MVKDIIVPFTFVLRIKSGALMQGTYPFWPCTRVGLRFPLLHMSICQLFNECNMANYHIIITEVPLQVVREWLQTLIISLSKVLIQPI